MCVRRLVHAAKEEVLTHTPPANHTRPLTPPANHTHRLTPPANHTRPLTPPANHTRPSLRPPNHTPAPPGRTYFCGKAISITRPTCSSSSGRSTRLASHSRQNSVGAPR